MASPRRLRSLAAMRCVARRTELPRHTSAKGTSLIVHNLIGADNVGLPNKLSVARDELLFANSSADLCDARVGAIDARRCSREIKEFLRAQENACLRQIIPRPACRRPETPVKWVLSRALICPPRYPYPPLRHPRAAGTASPAGAPTAQTVRKRTLRQIAPLSIAPLSRVEGATFDLVLPQALPAR